MNFIKYFQRGLAVASLVMTKIPQYMSDETITVDEMAEFMVEVCRICNWTVQIKIPENIQVLTIEVLKD